MKILVIQVKMIGDVLVSSLVCEQLKKQYPQAQIHYLINRNTKAIVENHPSIDRVIEFAPDYGDSLSSILRLIKRLRKTNYDLLVDVYAKPQTALVSLFSRAKRRISYRKAYNRCCYHTTVQRHRRAVTQASPAIENRLRLVVAETELPQAVKMPHIYLTDSEKQWAKSQLHKINPQNQKIIMVSALGSSDNKTYPLPKMAQLLDQVIAKQPCKLLFTYLPHQQPQAKQLYQMLNPQTQNHTEWRLNDSSLRQFLAILYYCQAIIGNEGGAINMAKALGVPSFAVYAPWIEQNEWNFFEDGKQHCSVHLHNFRPELLTGSSTKQQKHQAQQLYQQFKPELFIESLLQFCSRNLNQAI